MSGVYKLTPGRISFYFILLFTFSLSVSEFTLGSKMCLKYFAQSCNGPVGWGVWAWTL